ncbi:hypothetical protein CYMTET_56755 [Cymbomonas tetramitiformis]|uniref:UBA domain-containing protein n=1 Tax=Cymbomonas tetramitiformis TaxID=36881 RepID=A0AAE0BBH2_9CHLO|nr:hypothetical protein CYMTET_56755 [Cymbomonas tetramitiformis]
MLDPDTAASSGWSVVHSFEEPSFWMLTSDLLKGLRRQVPAADHIDIDEQLEELDIKTQLRTVEALIESISEVSSPAVKVALESVEEATKMLRTDLSSLSSELNKQSRRWFQRWRPANTTAIVQKLTCHRKILNGRVDLLVKCIGVTSAIGSLSKKNSEEWKGENGEIEAAQLELLRNMGFPDDKLNAKVLDRNEGDLRATATELSQLIKHAALKPETEAKIAPAAQRKQSGEGEKKAGPTSTRKPTPEELSQYWLFS